MPCRRKAFAQLYYDTPFVRPAGASDTRQMVTSKQFFNQRAPKLFGKFLC